MKRHNHDFAMRITRIGALAVAVCSSLQCSKFPTDTVPPPATPGFQKGMTLACWAPDCMGTPGTETSLQRIADDGAEWVAVVVTGYQERATSTAIQYDVPAGPDDNAVTRAIEQASARGFKTTLKPHVDVRDGTWRGQLRPDDQEAWFANYTEFILHYARLAERLQVEQFVIGTELVSLNREETRWRRLIQATRDLYAGAVLYAASWNEYERIAFWDALDYAGINAYFPLTNMKDPSMIDLLAGWDFWISRLEQWQRQIGKPVLFTEIGYTRRDGTNIRPYDFRLQTPIDRAEQADCYEAALRTFPTLPWLHGVYWWHWPGSINGSGADGSEYSPLGQPAETVLQQAWKGSE